MNPNKLQRINWRKKTTRSQNLTETSWYFSVSDSWPIWTGDKSSPLTSDWWRKRKSIPFFVHLVLASIFTSGGVDAFLTKVQTLLSQLAGSSANMMQMQRALHKLHQSLSRYKPLPSHGAKRSGKYRELGTFTKELLKKKVLKPSRALLLTSFSWQFHHHLHHYHNDHYHLHHDSFSGDFLSRPTHPKNPRDPLKGNETHLAIVMIMMMTMTMVVMMMVTVTQLGISCVSARRWW